MSDFNNIHRVPRIEPYVPDRTELLGDATKQFTDSDIGKAVKYDGATMVLCADSDPIVGFITSVEPYSSSGHSVGSVKMDVNTEFLATDEDGALAVGDMVVSGTPIVLNTVNGANGPNVKSTGSGSVLSNAGLAIKAGASALAKSVNEVVVMIAGLLTTKAAGDMTALAGTVTNATFNVYAFFVDAAGTLTTVMGTAGATLAAVVHPVAVAGTAQIGYVVINPTGTGDFIGGTTALDDATVVPNAVYVDTPVQLGAAQAHKWEVVSIYVDPSIAGTQVMVRKVG